MKITLVRNLADAINGKTVKNGKSTMIRVAASMVNLFESHLANKVLNMHADSEEDMQEIETLRQNLDAATDENEKNRLQKLIDKKEGKLETLMEETAVYNELLSNPLDLSMSSEEIMSANNAEPSTEPTPEIATDVPEPVQTNDTVASPVIDEAAVTNENDETTYGVTPEETAESTNEIVQEEIPEPVNSDTINEDVAAPTDIIPDEPESQSMPSDDLSTMEDVFPDAQMQTEGATPEGSEDVASIPDESNPVEDILNQTDKSNDFSSEVFGVDTTSMAPSKTSEIPEPVNFKTLGEDVAAPTNIIPEEAGPQSMPSDDWSTMEDVFPDAQMQTGDATPVETAPTQEISILDEMFNNYYNNGNAETVIESEPVTDEVPTDEPTEPVISETVEEAVQDEQPIEETTIGEVTEATQEDAGKQYEDELSKRLTFVYGENYADEITKEENADRVQRIEEAVSNDIEIENKVNEELEDYKKHLLSEGFEEDSDDMLYLLGSKREIAEHELMYPATHPDAKAELKDLNKGLLEEEEKRKIGKQTEPTAPEESISSLANELDSDAELTVVGDNAKHLIHDIHEDDDSLKNPEIPEEKFPVNSVVENPANDVTVADDKILHAKHLKRDIHEDDDSLKNPEIPEEEFSVNLAVENPANDVTVADDKILHAKHLKRDIYDGDDSLKNPEIPEEEFSVNLAVENPAKRTLGEVVYGSNWSEDYNKANEEEKKYMQEAVNNDLAYRYAVVSDWPIESARALLEANFNYSAEDNAYSDAYNRLVEYANEKWNKCLEDGTLEAKINAFKARENIYIEDAKEEENERLRAYIKELRTSIIEKDSEIEELRKFVSDYKTNSENENVSTMTR